MRKTKSIRVTLKAAKRGNPVAMYQMGLWYERFAARTDKWAEAQRVAIEWMAASAAAGYVPATAWLGEQLWDDDAGVQAQA